MHMELCYYSTMRINHSKDLLNTTFMGSLTLTNNFFDGEIPFSINPTKNKKKGRTSHYATFYDIISDLT